MFTNETRNTALGKFGRSVRVEPWFYVYKHRLYVVRNDVHPDEVREWLAARYETHRKGHRYRVTTWVDYKERELVDAIYLETLTERDQVEIAMRWAITDQPVFRSGKQRNYRPIRLRPEEREQLEVQMEDLKERFYNEIAAKRGQE